MTGKRRSGALAILPKSAVADSRLSATGFRVLALLTCYADRDGWCWPRQGTLANELKTSRQAIGRQVQALAALGYVEITGQRRAENGRRIASLYRLIFARELLADDGVTRQHDVAWTRQPDVADQATSEVAWTRQPDVAEPCNTGVAARTYPLERTQERTTHLNDEGARGAPGDSGHERRNGNAAHDDVPSAIVEALTPPTQRDRELWTAALAAIGQLVSRANADRVAEVELLGRASDGGLRLRSPLSGQSISRFVPYLRRALADAGDSFAEAVEIIEC